MAACLLNDPLACIHKNDGEVSRRGTSHHVSGVLDVPRCVGDNELALRCRKITIRYINGNALLTLGLEAVGQQRQVDVFIATLLAGMLNGIHLVFKGIL